MLYAPSHGSGDAAYNQILSDSRASLFVLCVHREARRATRQQVRKTGGAGWPVSRVLSTPAGFPWGAVRPFLWTLRRRRVLAANPGGGAGMPLRLRSPASPAAPIRPCSRWGLPCRPRRRGRGGLLPHPFTLTAGRISPRRGGLLSVALSLGFDPRRPLAGTVFPWSPDFPPARIAPLPAVAQPPGAARHVAPRGVPVNWR